MKRGRNKERKTYEKPSYEAEEILEKMSLVCKTTYPAQGGPCKNNAGEGCTGGGNMIT